ncbi:DUF1772 domain-containing protein [Nocardia jinanensis]|uniref:DUF1772 domain-containing protein n=1 Tax=Nocardia jinanensis TaxID=382504 RepID=A0A917RTP5_9NOCA|nr:DUF1772 domain-containing protein [Nocardia jinanensis]GGL26123.1 hypothetical protein GCM10011588_46150 [Nocardia jinanensis]
MSTKRAIPLWLLVIFVGIQFGAGWYEKLGVIPQWADAPTAQTHQAMAESGFHRAGRAFWPFVSPVVALLALINLYLAWRTPVDFRRWWIAASALMACYALSSYTYFVPQMLIFQAEGAQWTPEHVESFIDTWTTLNYPRMVLGGIGWLFALRALSLSGRTTGPEIPAESAPSNKKPDPSRTV